MVLAYVCGAGKVTARPVEGEAGGPVGHGADLAVELGDAGAAGAGDGLVGGDLQADEPGGPVQRGQHRHRGHGRAVGVGDDALGRAQGVLGVDLGRRPAGRRGPSARPRSCRSRARRPRRPWGRWPWRRSCRWRTGPGPGRRSRRCRCPRRRSRVPCQASVRPADRAEAKNRSSLTGNPRSASRARMTPPTCPVAPNTPTRMGSSLSRGRGGGLTAFDGPTSGHACPVTAATPAGARRGPTPAARPRGAHRARAVARPVGGLLGAADHRAADPARAAGPADLDAQRLGHAGPALAGPRPTSWSASASRWCRCCWRSTC